MTMATDATRPRWRTELPFLVALGLGAAIRIVVATAFPPVFLVSDGPTYLNLADHLTPDPDRPVGYSIVLRGLSEIDTSLALVTTVQLVLGLLTATIAYALLRRWDVGPWVATLATLPLLFDSMQLLLEHAVLSDVLFGFLVVAGIAALAWSRDPRWWTTVLAGGLLGLATLVRVLGEPTVVLAALFLLLVATTWRDRLLHVALVAVAFAVPVTAYAAWYHHEHGAWAITQAGGRALYMRTTTFVDCDQVTMPDYERVLCPGEPLGERRDPTQYGWHDRETVPRLDPPPGVTQQQAMRDFALRVIRAQPGDYARDVTRDFLLSFLSTDRDDHYEMDTSVKWKFDTIVAYEHDSHYMKLAFDTRLGGIPAPRQPMADLMEHYGRLVYLPGPLALGLVVVALVGAVVRRPDERPSRRPLLLLTLALPLVLILVPDVTAQFVWRYQLPLVTMLPLSAALGWTRLRAPARPPAPTDRTEASPTAPASA